MSRFKGLHLILALFALAEVGCQRITPTAAPATATAVASVDAVGTSCTKVWLKAQLPRVQHYLAAVEAQILEAMPEIPGMHPYDWRSMLVRQSQEEDFYAYGAPLWLESEPEHMIELTISASLMCLNQLSTAAVSPTLSISDPALDIRVDWYINTGLSWLDEDIQHIVQAAYETDFSPDIVP